MPSSRILLFVVLAACLTAASHASATGSDEGAIQESKPGPAADGRLANRYGPKPKKKSLKADLDGDKIPDAYDKCPGQREDFDGYEDEDGCPESDNDKDGLPDVYDKCPSQPEDIDQFEDEDGCPDPDNDGDKIPDKMDGCPDEAEDMDDFEDLGGCPDPDNDGDGILDEDDRCPNKPGTRGRRGCPRR
ncbi:MAG: thrombospondin type 3 repeat-containing protein [Myxococcota bacterium]|nr:thrombospondin type 3 repeat-containing protein [Myxococcota bacterium]